MAKRVFHVTSFTPTATADTTALANSTYMAILGGSATQLVNVLEILINGQATTSAPTFMQFARDSTVGLTPTALAAPAGDGPMHPSTAPLAAPPVTYNLAGTAPQRAAVTTQGKLELGLNAFGGIMKWNPYTPDMAWGILSATQPLGESSLSAFTGGTVGPVSAHIIYEPL
jgi:hypothetical protein